MSRPGISRGEGSHLSAKRRQLRPAHMRPGEAGFTLFEMLVVMTIVAMTMASMSLLYRTPSGASLAKSTALLTASRLRDLRAVAMSTGSERFAEIAPAARVLNFSDGRPAVRLDPSIEIAVTAADSERRSPGTAGIRFFPNGSSTGATITLKSDRQSYEVRVNWLTGRVSASAL
jgi:general secretion pathway protein H